MSAPENLAFLGFAMSAGAAAWTAVEGDLPWLAAYCILGIVSVAVLFRAHRRAAEPTEEASRWGGRRGRRAGARRRGRPPWRRSSA